MTASRTESETVFDTPRGEARVVTYPADSAGAASEAPAEVLLSHGAGGGIDARDLAVLARTLPAASYTVHLLEQPWRRAGRKIAGAPATLDEALLCAVEVLEPRGPLILGGRSAGARSAARSAGRAEAKALLALSFPLHPPGRPERSRWDEVAGVQIPTLLAQGERDPMGRPEEFPDPLPDQVDLLVIPEADHGLRVPARAALDQPAALAVLSEGVIEWLVRIGLGR